MKLVESSVALACAEGEQGVRAGVDVAVRERKEGYVLLLFWWQRHLWLTFLERCNK